MSWLIDAGLHSISKEERVLQYCRSQTVVKDIVCGLKGKGFFDLAVRTEDQIHQTRTEESRRRQPKSHPVVH
jgi:hypothetical protein